MFSGLRTSLTYARYSRLKQVHKVVAGSRSIQFREHSTSSETETFTEESGNGLDVSTALYPTHRPTNTLQKVLLTVGSAGMAILDPARGDMVASLGDVTAHQALQIVRTKMEADPVGRQILEEQPLITTETVSIDYLGSLPENTFGKEYWRFLTVHGFSPDARLPVHYVDDRELMYVMLRYRQCHDLFHTALGMKPNMLGEVVVKWVEAIQTGLPMCAMGAVFGPLRLGPKHRQKYLNTYMDWAIRNARNSKFLMNVYFENHWETDLEQFRAEHNIEPPPEPPYPQKQ